MAGSSPAMTTGRNGDPSCTDCAQRGGELVDIADRDALYDAMDDANLYRTDG
jgi:hypothetical protein